MYFVMTHETEFEGPDTYTVNISAKTREEAEERAQALALTLNELDEKDGKPIKARDFIIAKQAGVLSLAPPKNAPKLVVKYTTANPRPKAKSPVDAKPKGSKDQSKAKKS